MARAFQSVQEVAQIACESQTSQTQRVVFGHKCQPLRPCQHGLQLMLFTSPFCLVNCQQASAEQFTLKYSTYCNCLETVHPELLLQLGPFSLSD